jgi:hypothetical protein
MGRTVEEVLVTGRTTQEVKEEINRWHDEMGIKKEEERDDFVRGRMGIPGGLGLTAPKYFRVLDTEGQGCPCSHRRMDWRLWHERDKFLEKSTSWWNTAKKRLENYRAIMEATAATIKIAPPNSMW